MTQVPSTLCTFQYDNCFKWLICLSIMYIHNGSVDIPHCGKSARCGQGLPLCCLPDVQLTSDSWRGHDLSYYGIILHDHVVMALALAMWTVCCCKVLFRARSCPSISDVGDKVGDKNTRVCAWEGFGNGLWQNNSRCGRCLPEISEPSPLCSPSKVISSS